MLSEILKDKHLILASQSPRRHQLLKKLGVKFSIQTSAIEEVYPSHLKEEHITNYLATLKAKAFENKLRKQDILITSDTIVWQNNKALEKPKNIQEAVQMLQKLSGSSHKVITSICLKTKKTEKVFFDTTIVHFKILTNEEINYYVKNFKPFDKAGGYGIQEWIGYIGVTKLEGSYFNVMGLPVHKLYEELLKM
jgi:septum formation protein